MYVCMCVYAYDNIYIYLHNYIHIYIYIYMRYDLFTLCAALNAQAQQTRVMCWLSSRRYSNPAAHLDAFGHQAPLAWVQQGPFKKRGKTWCKMMEKHGHTKKVPEIIWKHLRLEWL